MAVTYLKRADKTPQTGTDETREIVQAMLAKIEAGGEDAVIAYGRELDGYHGDIVVPADVIAAAGGQISQQLKDDIRFAYDRVTTFAEAQKKSITEFETELSPGLWAGQKLIPIETAGCYVPGGRYAHVASAIMSIATARVAGVEHIVACTAPRGDAGPNPAILYAMDQCGADTILALGGVQGIAAMTFGLFTGKPARILVGPGNRFVAEAKRQVFGRVGIDMVAGPSEILILADGSVDPEWVTMDLFAQAEHDEYAQAVLISPESDYLDAVAACIARLLPTLSRRDIVTAALKNRGALIKVPDIASAVALSNRMAPEHLELALADPDSVVGDIRAAGAIFMGAMSSEALGDYCAGPNHVLPTAGSARFASPLGVYDFQRRSSLIKVSEQGAHTLGEVAALLADAEALEAHGLSAQKRMRGGD